MKRNTLLITLLLACICQLSFAQGTTPQSSTSSNASSGNADPATTDFITNATVSNLKEVATGKLAVKKAKDPSVKAFGDKMIQDHTMATKEMAALVKSKHIKVTKPSAEMVAPDSSLMKSSGAEFDKMYVTMMITDHQNAIALFQTASTQLSDPDLKAFAVKTLPMLKQHLAQIQGIASKMNISSAQ